MELIKNAEVQKFYFQDSFQQTLAGSKQGLKKFEVWRLSLAPGSEVPASRYAGEVVALTLQGNGRMVVDGNQVDVRPDTTLVIPPDASRQISNLGTGELVILLIRAVVPA